MTNAMGPPPPRSSTDTVSKTSEEILASSSPPTSISSPPEPEPQTGLVSNVSVSNPMEQDISPVVNSNPTENKNVEDGDVRIPEQQLSVSDLEAFKAPGETPDSTGSKSVEDDGGEKTKKKRSVSNSAAPYSKPSWSGLPCHPYSIEILKDGAVIDQHNINEKDAYMFGRVDLCDFVLEHPTISRFHAVIQFNSDGNAYLYDVGSTHGTSINKKQVKARVYVDLHVGDVIRFGQSSRLYIFQGPTNLMPPEADLKSLRSAKTHLDMQDMEASLRRAKINAALSDGVSWGMQEDAVEEIEEDVEEITWQTYKGQLTEKQEKTKEKVVKRLEKITHMKKEIDAIRAKDIAQGGLTQGQQTQIARNEQRIEQILEELENLEETLNDSIRESIGARTGRTSYGKRKGDAEDGEDDYQSDDDEFYDRTKKPLKRKIGESQSVETADSLLDKQETIAKEMADVRNLIAEEDKKQVNEIPETGDALDAYMTAISTDLVTDKKDKLQKELASLQTELDRVLYLLKIADPSGEAAKRRASSKDKPKENVTAITAPAFKQPQSRKPEQQLNDLLKPTPTLKPPSDKISSIVAKPEAVQKSEKVETTNEKPTVYVEEKPQWLGAVDGVKKEDGGIQITSEAPQEEDNQFVDYKDRKNILQKTVVEAQINDASEIENAAPGLIVRKRKATEEKPEINYEDNKDSEESGMMQAEDAVALLLRHSRGYSALDEEAIRQDTEDEAQGSHQNRRKQKKPKKALGPERPAFLTPHSDDTWVPPEGQSGDGRTSLNDRYGY